MNIKNWPFKVFVSAVSAAIVWITRWKASAQKPPPSAPAEPPPFVEPSPAPPPAPVPWRPALQKVRAWKTDFLGRWDKPLFMIGGMNISERREQYAWMHQHGYTHVPLAVGNTYSGFPRWHWDWWGNPNTLSARLDELYAEHLIPVLVLHPLAGMGIDVHLQRVRVPGMGIDVHLQRVRSLWADVGPNVRAVMWGWEINDLGGDWGNGTAQLRYLDGLSRIVGDVPMYVHFTRERWSGWPSFDGSEPDKDEVQWLRRAQDLGVTGLLYQDHQDKPLAEVMERALEIRSPHGWAPGICGRVQEGAGLDFILFEWSRDERRHADGVRRIEADGRAQGYG